MYTTKAIRRRLPRPPSLGLKTPAAMKASHVHDQGHSTTAITAEFSLECPHDKMKILSWSGGPGNPPAVFGTYPSSHLRRGDTNNKITIQAPKRGNSVNGPSPHPQPYQPPTGSHQKSQHHPNTKNQTRRRREARSAENQILINTVGMFAKPFPVCVTLWVLTFGPCAHLVFDHLAYQSRVK